MKSIFIISIFLGSINAGATEALFPTTLHLICKEATVTQVNPNHPSIRLTGKIDLKGDKKPASVARASGSVEITYSDAKTKSFHISVPMKGGEYGYDYTAVSFDDVDDATSKIPHLLVVFEYAENGALKGEGLGAGSVKTSRFPLTGLDCSLSTAIDD